MVTADEQQLAQKINKQFNFYFSDANLTKDRFLRERLDNAPDSFLPINLFQSFNMIKNLKISDEQIAEILEHNDFFVLSDDKKLIKRTTKFEYKSEDPLPTVYLTDIDKSIGFKAFKEGVSLVSEVQSLIPADILDSVVYITPFREGERKYFSGTAKLELNSEADVERFINHAWEGDLKPTRSVSQPSIDPSENSISDGTSIPTVIRPPQIVVRNIPIINDFKRKVPGILKQTFDAYASHIISISLSRTGENGTATIDFDEKSVVDEIMKKEQEWKIEGAVLQITLPILKEWEVVADTYQKPVSQIYVTKIPKAHQDPENTLKQLFKDYESHIIRMKIIKNNRNNSTHVVVDFDDESTAKEIVGKQGEWEIDGIVLNTKIAFDKLETREEFLARQEANAIQFCNGKVVVVENLPADVDMRAFKAYYEGKGNNILQYKYESSKYASLLVFEHADIAKSLVDACVISSANETTIVKETTDEKVQQPTTTATEAEVKEDTLNTDDKPEETHTTEVNEDPITVEPTHNNSFENVKLSFPSETCVFSAQEIFDLQTRVYYHLEKIEGEGTACAGSVIKGRGEKRKGSGRQTGYKGKQRGGRGRH